MYNVCLILLLILWSCKLGDDEDHSTRAPRSLTSPSPRQDERHRAEEKEQALAEMTDSYKNLLMSIGEDPNREGLQRTPERAAKAFLYFTKGYDEKIGGECMFSKAYTESRLENLRKHFV